MRPTRRAEIAREILNNEVFNEATDTLERGLVAEWKASPTEAWKRREETYIKLQALLDIKAQLETFIATAAMETTA